MKELTVIGIDPDTKKLSIVETRYEGQKKPWVHTIPLPSVDDDERCGYAFRGVSELLANIIDRDEGRLPVIYMEAPVMGVGGPGATIPQAFVQGAVMAAATEFRCKIYKINNQSWKKRVCGNGGISKEEIRERMEGIWPELARIARDQQDLVDAGAINLYGRFHQKVLRRFRKAQKDA